MRPGLPAPGLSVFPDCQTKLKKEAATSPRSLAEQAGLEPTRRNTPANGLAIRCSTTYAYCSIYLFRGMSQVSRIFLHSGALCHAQGWRRVEDSNLQDPIADVHVGFLDR